MRLASLQVNLTCREASRSAKSAAYVYSVRKLLVAATS